MASREAALTGMAAFRTSLYNICMRRNSIYMTAVIVAGYASTNTYFSGTDSIWKSLNKGVSFCIFYFVVIYLSLSSKHYSIDVKTFNLLILSTVLFFIYT